MIDDYSRSPINLLLTRPGPIGLAETRGNGYVFSDTLLKKKTLAMRPRSEKQAESSRIGESRAADPRTQYLVIRETVLQVKRPNQQHQSIEGK